MIHQGRTDKSGNYRDRSRPKDGHIIDQLGKNGVPFEAIVVAWYPRSQTIDAAVPTRFGQTVIEGIVVYGNFFEATGTIQGPKIATTFKEGIYSTVRENEQSDKNSDEYVLDNNIAALVFKTDVGEYTSSGFATSSFRFLTDKSALLSNAKQGRKITRHDDGSYSIHDADGNMQFKHPSGLNLIIGKSTEDIELEVPFPDHEKNVQDYGGKVKVKLKHPSGSVFEYDDDGLLKIEGGTGKNVKTIIDAFVDEVAKIVVANGTGPDVAALNQLKTDMAEVLL